MQSQLSNTSVYPPTPFLDLYHWGTFTLDHGHLGDQSWNSQYCSLQPKKDGRCFQWTRTCTNHVLQHAAATNPTWMGPWNCPRILRQMDGEGIHESPLSSACATCARNNFQNGHHSSITSPKWSFRAMWLAGAFAHNQISVTTRRMHRWSRHMQSGASWLFYPLSDLKPPPRGM